MRAKPYGSVCPITHACEVLEPRWTIPILSEMWGGSIRFNAIKRGVGNISPALLAKRWKELEAHGLIERVKDPATGWIDYLRTQRAIDLEPALDALANWAPCNIEARQALKDADLSNLMGHMRGLIDPDQLPNRQVVIRFRFSDPDPEYDTYRALICPGTPVEICSSVPGFDVDLYVVTDKISLTTIILSRTTIGRELDEGRLFLSGDALLARTRHRSATAGCTAQPSSRPPKYLQVAPRGVASVEFLNDCSLDTSRGFRALKVWIMLKTHGTDTFGAIIDRNMAHARHLAVRIAATPGLELMAPVAIDIVCFRADPGGMDQATLRALNTEIMLRIRDSGFAVFADTIIPGRHALRVAICNHRTRTKDLDLLVDEVLRHAADLPRTDAHHDRRCHPPRRSPRSRSGARILPVAAFQARHHPPAVSGARAAGAARRL